MMWRTCAEGCAGSTDNVICADDNLKAATQPRESCGKRKGHSGLERGDMSFENGGPRETHARRMGCLILC